MNFRLRCERISSGNVITISGSKSESNRALVLQALYPEISIENLSDSDDTVALQNALATKSEVIDIGHAGTAMRFLTAYFAITDCRTVILTGSDRMKQRPIGILVDALRQLGAHIEYLDKSGFPPIKITGKKLVESKISLDADVSSQFVSALLLIAPKLENGLEITLNREVTSRPYIELTLAILSRIGVQSSVEENKIKVWHLNPRRAIAERLSIESDWSSASYFYSIVALSSVGTEITLANFKRDSFQGDSALSVIYENFGVKTVFKMGEMTICKTESGTDGIFVGDLSGNPDLAQTIAITCLGLDRKCRLTGLHTLKIKETDRLESLKSELEKLGAAVSVTTESIEITPRELKPDVIIETYDDHRMAMAFAPLALKIPIQINDVEVVSKSYRAFWTDLSSIGFSVRKT